LIRRLTALALIVLGTSAGAEVCKWTVQIDHRDFKVDDVLGQPPRIEKSACKTGQAPICSGYVYCKALPTQVAENDPPLNGVGVACKSIKVGEQWQCPDAETCYKDPDVSIRELLKAPSNGRPEPVAAPADPVRTVN